MDTYRFYNHRNSHDVRGYYIPDGLITQIIESAIGYAPSQFEHHRSLGECGLDIASSPEYRIPAPATPISWTACGELVTAAFQNFDLELGEKAREAFQRPERWKLKTASLGNAGGVCFLRENTHPPGSAVIDFSRDGSINDPIYAGHELGHLIAADYSAARVRRSPLTSPALRHMAEIQAFFTQHIVYRQLCSCDVPDLAEAASLHFAREITSSLYFLPCALGSLAVDHSTKGGREKFEAPHHDVYERILHEWLGANWHDFRPALTLNTHLHDDLHRDLLGIRHLHTHRMASIIATGLFAVAEASSPSRRSMIIEAVLDSRGRSITQVLDAIGISDQASRARFADQSIRSLFAPIDRLVSEHEISRSRRPQYRPHGNISVAAKYP